MTARRVAARRVDGVAVGCVATNGSTVSGVAAGSVTAGGEATNGSAAIGSAKNRKCVGKGRTGGNSATVVGAGAVGRPKHSRAGDTVAGGVGKGAAAGKAA